MKRRNGLACRTPGLSPTQTTLVVQPAALVQVSTAQPSTVEHLPYKKFRDHPCASKVVRHPQLRSGPVGPTRENAEHIFNFSPTRSMCTHTISHRERNEPAFH